MTKIWGHRGAYDHAPENTLTSFKLAAEMGADGIELDIQLSRDGEIVIIHDETLDRVSDGHGYVKDYLLRELKQLNFNKRKLTGPLFEEIPTLREFLALIAPYETEINIELKTDKVFYEDIERKALKLADEFGLQSRVVWSSFNHYSVSKIRQLEPQARTALLCGSGVLTTGEQCEMAGAEALHCNIRQMRYPGLLEDCHKRGVKVRPYTVILAEDVLYAYKSGFDGVFVNNIKMAQEERDRLAR